MVDRKLRGRKANFSLSQHNLLIKSTPSPYTMFRSHLFLALLACFHGTQYPVTDAFLSSNVRTKRDLPCGGGCLSKYAPINCRCSNVANSDELLCRCDRALVISTSPQAAPVREREELPPPAAHCPGHCRTTGDPPPPAALGFGASRLHSACHPICHKSCMSSCTRDRGDQLGYPPPPTSPYGEFHRDQSTGSCAPSQCKANCLRACSRIMDAHQVPVREPIVSGSDGGIEPHYQVEPTPTRPAEYGSSGSAGSGTGCQCSPAAMCDCQEACYPICYDTCESNCLQQAIGQRRQCAQMCHLECQRNCGSEQQTQQQHREAKKPPPIESTNNNGLRSNNIGNNNPWTNEINGGGTQGNPLIACAQKCPRACEQACLSAQNDEPSSGCLPACVGLCAQSCARGMQFDAAGTVQLGLGGQQQQPAQSPYGQQPLIGLPMPAMALDLAAIREAQQQQQNRSIGTDEFDQRQRQQLNDWVGGDQMEPLNNNNNWTNETTVSIVPVHTVFHSEPQRDWKQHQVRAVPGVMGPCAPLCQPECLPECNRRYLERGSGRKRPPPSPRKFQKLLQDSGLNKGAGIVQGQGPIFPPHIILDEGLLEQYRNGTMEGESEEELKELNNNSLLWLQPQNETGHGQQNHDTGNESYLALNGTRSEMKSVANSSSKKSEKFIDKEKPRAKRIRNRDKITRASEFFSRRRTINMPVGDKSRIKDAKKDQKQQKPVETNHSNDGGKMNNAF